jgi:hypothetical protein
MRGSFEVRPALELFLKTGLSTIGANGLVETFSPCGTEILGDCLKAGLPRFKESCECGLSIREKELDEDAAADCTVDDDVDSTGCSGCAEDEVDDSCDTSSSPGGSSIDDKVDDDSIEGEVADEDGLANVDGVADNDGIADGDGLIDEAGVVDEDGAADEDGFTFGAVSALD